MTSIKNTFLKIRKSIKNTSFKAYITVFLEGIGLFANTIAIVAFFGAQNTPETSPNFYVNNQEFFVWSLIAAVYTLGLISARFKRRLRRKLSDAGIEEETYPSFRAEFFRSRLHKQMFQRDFSFTLAVIFPLTLLYVIAMQAAATEGSASPWDSLGITVLVCIPTTFGVMLASSVFDKALSLYSGD